MAENDENEKTKKFPAAKPKAPKTELIISPGKKIKDITRKFSERTETFMGRRIMLEVAENMAAACGMMPGDKLELKILFARRGSRTYDFKDYPCRVGTYNVLERNERLCAAPAEEGVEYFDRLGDLVAHAIGINKDTGLPFTRFESDNMNIDVRGGISKPDESGKDYKNSRRKKFEY